MKKIGETIIEDGILNQDNNKTRKTVRGVIIEDKQVYMLYSELFDDYTFPGGGVKHDEDKIEALKRELYEEIGAKEIVVKDKIGYTVEMRFGLNSNNSIYEQTSYYYLVEVLEQGKPHFVGREKEQGINPKWVKIDDAIAHNNYIIDNKRCDDDAKGFKTVLVRENTILKHIKENLL